MGTRVAVAASNSIATDAGLRLAELGGNAVDTAIAAVLVAMVCEPGVASLGGGAFVTLAPADGSPPVTVDGNVEMPGRGLDADRFGQGVRDIFTEYAGGTAMGVGHGGEHMYILTHVLRNTPRRPLAAAAFASGHLGEDTPTP